MRAALSATCLAGHILELLQAWYSPCLSDTRQPESPITRTRDGVPATGAGSGLPASTILLVPLGTGAVQTRFGCFSSGMARTDIGTVLPSISNAGPGLNKSMKRKDPVNRNRSRTEQFRSEQRICHAWIAILVSLLISVSRDQLWCEDPEIYQSDQRARVVFVCP